VAIFAACAATIARKAATSLGSSAGVIGTGKDSMTAPRRGTCGSHTGCHSRRIVPDLVHAAQHTGPPYAGKASLSGRLRLLAPYSPDFNPIELAFAKLKAPLRRAAARTTPPLGRQGAPDVHTRRMRQLLHRLRNRHAS
jgi:hypothetical protein